MHLRQIIKTFFWRKTVQNLSDEFEAGIRNEITREDAELAKAYERKRMPANIRYPIEGEIYEALQDYKIDYLTAHSTPYTGGGRALLRKGESVRVLKITEKKPIGIYCAPLNYDSLHNTIVPAEVRYHPNYRGYYFSIDTSDLNRCFRRVVK